MSTKMICTISHRSFFLASAGLLSAMAVLASPGASVRPRGLRVSATRSSRRANHLETDVWAYSGTLPGRRLPERPTRSSRYSSLSIQKRDPPAVLGTYLKPILG